MNVFVFTIHTNQFFLRRAHYMLTMPQMSSSLPIRTSPAHTTFSFESSSYKRPCFKKKKHSKSLQIQSNYLKSIYAKESTIDCCSSAFRSCTVNKSRIKFSCLITSNGLNYQKTMQQLIFRADIADLWHLTA